MKVMHAYTHTYKKPARFATEKQRVYVSDLLQKRNYNVLSAADTALIETIVDELAQPIPCISREEVTSAINLLLACRPNVSDVAEVGSLTAMIMRLPISKYALPRKDGSGWDFFEITERRNGRRYVNRLLGAPSDWRREYLTVHLQCAALRAISEDPKAAAIAYARQHGRCAVCNSPLSNPASIAQSMGPVCAKRF